MTNSDFWSIFAKAARLKMKVNRVNSFMVYISWFRSEHVSVGDTLKSSQVNMVLAYQNYISADVFDKCVNNFSFQRAY